MGDGWFQSILIPCPLKKLTGLDCPLCGFQRSVIALLQGDIKASLHLYPATLLIIILAALYLKGPKWKTEKILLLKKALLIITAVIVTASYILKMSVHFIA